MTLQALETKENLQHSEKKNPVICVDEEDETLNAFGEQRHFGRNYELHNTFLIRNNSGAKMRPNS